MKKNIFKTSFYVLSLFALLACGKPQSDADEKRIVKSSLIASTGKLWPNKSTLVVTFMDGTPELKAEVERFAKEWTNYANLKFEFYPSEKKIPRNKSADITITFNTNVHTSAVGTDSKSLVINKASMNLALLNDANINSRRAIILHEFGHAIGLEHEHQHKLRTIDFDETKIVDACRKHINFTEEMCNSFILTKLDSSDKYFSPYDLLSIMHYSLHSDFFKSKISMRNNMSLSLNDKVEIAKLYPGKSTKEQIILDHQIQQIEIKELEVYKNCRLVESAQEQLRQTDRGVVLSSVKYYNIESVIPRDFSDNSMWEDKEGVIVRMQSLEYCNLSEGEIAARITKKKAEQFAGRIYNSCFIAVTEDGLPSHKGGCGKDFPIQILDVKKQKSVDNLCHQSFEAALPVMKAMPECR